MLQTAVFVDAGYVFAQGSNLLTGSRAPRQRVALNIEAALHLLSDVARAAAPDGRLLRIYWYDGRLRGGVLTTEQVALGRAANVKLRLGLVNSKGEQKGVDSLIVTDLIELARNSAISDAIIMSGDEDIRVGLQVAQTYGVRVQLLGIKPALGSQSPELVAEADTHVELSDIHIAPVLSIRPAAASGASEPVIAGSFLQIASGLVPELVAELGDQKQQMLAYADANRGQLHSDFDRPSLARLRDRLGRDVVDDERKRFRTLLRNELKK